MNISGKEAHIDLSRFSTVIQKASARLSLRRDKADERGDVELAARIDRELCGLQYGEAITRMLQQYNNQYSDEDILGAIGMGGENV